MKPQKDTGENTVLPGTEPQASRTQGMYSDTDILCDDVMLLFAQEA
jgi:hypothetical protein